jgi:hypothetical protein
VRGVGEEREKCREGRRGLEGGDFRLGNEERSFGCIEGLERGR